MDLDYIMPSDWLGGYRWFPLPEHFTLVKKRELPVSNALWDPCLKMTYVSYKLLFPPFTHCPSSPLHAGLSRFLFWKEGGWEEGAGNALGFSRTLLCHRLAVGLRDFYLLAFRFSICKLEIIMLDLCPIYLVYKLPGGSDHLLVGIIPTTEKLSYHLGPLCTAIKYPLNNYVMAGIAKWSCLLRLLKYFS